MHSLKFINKNAKINNHPDMNYGITYLEECSKFQFIKCPGCFLISPDSQHSSALWTLGRGTMEWTRLKSVSSLFTNSCVSLPQNQGLHRSTCQCLFIALVCKAWAAQENPVVDWRATNAGMAAWTFPNSLNFFRLQTVSPLSTLSHGYHSKKVQALLANSFQCPLQHHSCWVQILHFL